MKHIINLLTGLGIIGVCMGAGYLLFHYDAVKFGVMITSGLVLAYYIGLMVND